MAKPVDVKSILQRYQNSRAIKRRSDSLREDAGRFSWPIAQDQERTTQVKNEGDTRTLHLYDSTALQAAYKMTSGMFSYLMPVGARWFEFVAQDFELNNDQFMKGWLSTATALSHKEIWRSNFQREMFITIRSMIVFGTGIISVEKVGDEIVFQSHHIGHMSFEQNSRGEIDTVYRQIFYTARQAAQEFGRENLGKGAMEALEKGNLEQMFEYVHTVAPNNDFDPDKIGSKVKRFRSVYIDVTDKKVVKDSGFDDMPYLVARFSLAPGEIFGRGPVIELLPEIRMLNRMKKSFIESSEKAVNPPLVVEDDGVVGQPVTSPNGLIYIRTGAQMPTPLNTGTNVALNAELIRDQQNVVKEGLFNDLFQALAQHRNMTATEVVERVEEKIVQLAPAVTSLQKEIFSPLLSRILNLLIKMNRIPEPPQSFDFDVVYQGRLALAMSNMQTNAIEATLAKWAPYAPVSNVFDNVDFDMSFRTSWLNSGAPAEGLKDQDIVDQGRQQIQEMQEAQAQAEIADTGSKAVLNIANASQGGGLEGIL